MRRTRDMAGAVAGLLRPPWQRAFENALDEAIDALPASADPDLLVARLEAMGRVLLLCDEVRIAIGPDAAPNALLMAPPESPRVEEVMDLGDDPFGARLSAVRLRGPAFSDADHWRRARFVQAITRTLICAAAIARMARERDELERLLSAIVDGMLTLDRGGRIRTVNEPALLWIGARREEIVGLPLWEVWAGQCEPDLRQCCADVLRTGIGTVLAARCEPRGAHLTVRVDVFPSGLAVFLRDVTAERDVEEKLRQSQKLEVIGQLTGGIAHDVNNMLTVMVSNLEALSERAADRLEWGAGQERFAADAAVDHSLATAALRAGDSAAQLVGRLVAFSRRQPLSPRVIDVAALLQALGTLLRRSLGEAIALRISAEPGLWQALVDPSELESAILNLALNAQDAMPDGGTLDIVAANVDVDRVYAAVSGLDQTGHFIAISVADTGVGMSREVALRAFDPFFTTKEAGRGTGLGLSMVYGFARQSAGLATIDSEPGAGTIVRIYLPRSTAVPSPLLPIRALQVALGGTGQVLLVEDNDHVRARVESMLRGLGYAVAATADGPRALEAIRVGPRPDLLLTDVVLPGGMTGRDVADAVAALVPGIRVLFTSGYAGDVLLRDGRLSPGVALLSKPFRRAELAERVRAQLAAPPWPGDAGK